MDHVGPHARRGSGDGFMSLRGGRKRRSRDALLPGRHRTRSRSRAVQTRECPRVCDCRQRPPASTRRGRSGRGRGAPLRAPAGPTRGRSTGARVGRANLAGSFGPLAAAIRGAAAAGATSWSQWPAWSSPRDVDGRAPHRRRTGDRSGWRGDSGLRLGPSAPDASGVRFPSRESLPLQPFLWRALRRGPEDVEAEARNPRPGPGCGCVIGGISQRRPRRRRPRTRGSRTSSAPTPQCWRGGG